MGFSREARSTCITDILGNEQIQRIHEYRRAAATPIELRTAAIVTAGPELGLRASDVICLKRNDIDWKNKKVSIIQKKTGNAGFQYDHAKWILHKFDEFCVQEQVEAPLITRGLAEKWGTLREAERKTTLAGRVSVLRQMSLYMQAYRIRCHVPGKIPCESAMSHMS